MGFTECHLHHPQVITVFVGGISTIPSHGSMAARVYHIRSNIDAGFLLVGPHGASCTVFSAPGDNAGASCTAFVRQDGWLFVICGVLLWSYEDQVSCSLHMDQQRKLVLESLFLSFSIQGRMISKTVFYIPSLITQGCIHLLCRKSKQQFTDQRPE